MKVLLKIKTPWGEPAVRLTVMTYNVHSCRGNDGRVDPMRISRVIERYAPDVVALQELDSGLARTGRVDQAKLLADMLEMNHHFHPALHIEAGQYGNAVLSPHDMRLFRAGELPTMPGRGVNEKRGALWVKVKIEGNELQVLNTHLGLNRHERRAQAMALSGPEWLGHPECRQPVLLLGDMNTTRWSAVGRLFRDTLTDVNFRCGATWPSRFPVLRLDHIFASPGITAKDVVTPRDELTVEASDHLPVLATLEIPAKEEWT